MIETKLTPLSQTTIKLFDGDRGVNYPSKKDFSKSGFCLFLDSSNLTKNGFDFTSKVFITEEKDKLMGSGKLSRGDLVMNTRGTIGNVGHYKENILYGNIRINSGMLIIRGGNEFDNEFLYGFFRSKLFSSQIENIMSGSVQSQLPVWIFNFIQVPDFNVPAQRRISSVLSAIDSKIELNNRINAELESMAKIFYDYWFVQFDFPDKNGKPYKTSGGKMIWNEKLKREIPEGWKVENLKENLLSKLIKPGINKFEGEKIYLATADIINDEINFNADKITFNKRESRANMQPVENSLWFAKMKNSKKVLYLGEYSINYLKQFILSTGFAGLKCDSFSLEYLWNFINNEEFELIKDRLAGDKTTQSAINNNAMAYISLLIPAKEIIEKYHTLTSGVYKKNYLNQVKNQKLTELRDWILPMLINGQVIFKS